MVGACGCRALGGKTGLLKQTACLRGGDYVVGMRTHAAKGVLPVDNQHLTAGLKQTQGLGGNRRFVVGCKKAVGYNYHIKALVGQVRTTHLFDIAGYYLDIGQTLASGKIFKPRE